MVRIVAFVVSFLLLILLGGALGLGYVVWRFGSDLPEHGQLALYEPPVLSRVHAGDGRLIAEFAAERRLFQPIEAIPEPVVRAFLAAEDKNFYTHPGIDIAGILRAAIDNIGNMAADRRLVGASTITQQVVKNFLLTNEVSFERKIKEAILAFRLERALPKDRILELYLNQIYLGNRSYGVAAAALNYFGKSLNELSLAEAAYLAALPKAPNNYHPVRFHDRALARRNWVLERMVEDGAISRAAAEAAKAEPLEVRPPTELASVSAAHFAEEVRRQIVASYGEDALYRGGLTVRTTLDPSLQGFAQSALRHGLIAYDRRHGWRGAQARLDLDALGAEWPARLVALPLGPILPEWRPAVVLKLEADHAVIGLATRSADGEAVRDETGVLPLAEMRWARRQRAGGGLGPEVRRSSDVLARGDVILVERIAPEDEDDATTAAWALRQVPEVEGAIVALDPHTGRVLAMSGGFNYNASEFNRATQAWRQPGSAFKPFVYAAALDSGFTPASVILDAPVSFRGPNGKIWRPSNYSERFYGPSTLRLGLEKSRNVMTVRLADQVGMTRIVDYARRFGIGEDMEPHLAMALGAGETTLLRLTAAYGMLVNGGKQIHPHLIDRVQDRRGRTVMRRDDRVCEGCSDVAWQGQEPPALPDRRARVIDARTAYQVVSMLQGVVERGTATRVQAVGKTVAGKTGTSNEAKDVWFVGFSPDLVAGVFVGFDEPRSLGRETGSSAAAPIFTEFMSAALADQPDIPFRIPPGVRLVRVNATTGRPAIPGERNVIWEAFKSDTEIASAGRMGRGTSAARPSAPQSAAPPPPSLGTGTGGLY